MYYICLRLKTALWLFTIGILLTFFLNKPTQAQSIWQGIVTHVSDGDTLYIRELGQLRHQAQKVRIVGIDAPELCQTDGIRAKNMVHKLLQTNHYKVYVMNVARDRYDRLLAHIFVDDSAENDAHLLGLMLIKKGYAWSYGYTHNYSTLYEKAQTKAQNDKLGLFSDDAAVEPSIFRKTHGSCFSSNSTFPTRKVYSQ